MQLNVIDTYDEMAAAVADRNIQLEEQKTAAIFCVATDDTSGKAFQQLAKRIDKEAASDNQKKYS